MIDGASGVLGGLGRAAGGLVGLLGGAGSDGDKFYNRAIQVLQQVEDPNFDFRSLSAPELAFVAEFIPEVYEAVIPAEVKLAQDSPELRESQMRGLSYLEQVRDEGLPLSERLAAESAQRTVAKGAQDQQRALLRELAQRGRLGGGNEAVVRATANQQAADTARDQGNFLAREAVQNRLQAAQAASGLAGGIRAQDIDLSARNADSWNRFSEFISSLGTQAAADAAQSRNVANAYNTQTRQRVADTNAFSGYGTALDNVTRQNQLAEALAKFQLNRAAAQQGALGQRGAAQDASQAAKQKTLENIGEGLGSSIGGIASLFGGGFGF